MVNSLSPIGNSKGVPFFVLEIKYERSLKLIASQLRLSNSDFLKPVNTAISTKSQTDEVNKSLIISASFLKTAIVAKKSPS